MYVCSHWLQEVLKNLFWCSWNHSVSVESRRTCSDFASSSRDGHEEESTSWARTWCFRGWRHGDSFPTPALAARALLNAQCWLPHPRKNERCADRSNIVHAFEKKKKIWSSFYRLNCVPWVSCWSPPCPHEGSGNCPLWEQWRPPEGSL